MQSPDALTGKSALSDSEVKPLTYDPSIRRFARFFRIYGVSLGVVIAALPFGLSRTGFIDYYTTDRALLTFLASLVAFLSVAAVFGSRRHIGELVFPKRRTITTEENVDRLFFGVLIPAACGVLSILFFMFYAITLNYSVKSVAIHSAYSDTQTLAVDKLDAACRAQPRPASTQTNSYLFGDLTSELKVTIKANCSSIGTSYSDDLSNLSSVGYRRILSDTAPNQISYTFFLFVFYILAFALASTALVWHGVVEYVQGELGLSDADLISSPYRIRE